MYQLESHYFVLVIRWVGGKEKKTMLYSTLVDIEVKFGFEHGKKDEDTKTNIYPLCKGVINV